MTPAAATTATEVRTNHDCIINTKETTTKPTINKIIKLTS